MPIWKPAIIAAVLLAAQPALAAAPVYAGPLYPDGAQESRHWPYPRSESRSGNRVSVHNTRDPRITVHLPDRGKGNGAAVLLLPGGGLRSLGLGAETDAEIAAFLDLGVAVAVLEYRTLQTDPEALARQAALAPVDPATVRFPKLVIRNGNANPSPGDPALAEVQRLATDDARAGLRLLHARAGEWRIDPARIGAIGTSAGGGVAFGALLDGTDDQERPDFIVSIFGPALQDVAVPADAPPLFLVTEAGHGPVTDGILALFALWNEAGCHAELHVFDVPNFSMTVGLWWPRLSAWMRERGIVPAKP